MTRRVTRVQNMTSGNSWPDKAGCSERSVLVSAVKWVRWMLFIPYVLGLASLTPFKPPWIVCFLAFPVLFAVTRIWSSYRRIPQCQRLLYIGTVVACAIGGVLLVVITGVGAATICVGSDIPQPPGVRLDLPCHNQLDWAWVAVGFVIGVTAGLCMVAVITRCRPTEAAFSENAGSRRVVDGPGVRARGAAIGRSHRSTQRPATTCSRRPG